MSLGLAAGCDADLAIGSLTNHEITVEEVRRSALCLVRGWWGLGRHGRGRISRLAALVRSVVTVAVVLLAHSYVVAALWWREVLVR